MLLLALRTHDATDDLALVQNASSLAPHGVGPVRVGAQHFLRDPVLFFRLGQILFEFVQQ